MPLTLRIQSYRKQAPTVAVERRFDQQGGTIGRAAGNDLELPDPGKYISRNHCKVSFTNGRYTLIDLGSNPSWINERPLGTGKLATLEDGDSLMIGDYVLQVVVDAESKVAVPVFEPDYSPERPFQAQNAPPPRALVPEYVPMNDSLAGARILEAGVGPGGLAAPSADDPLGLNLFGQSAPVNAGAFRGSEFDHAAPQFMPLRAAVLPEPSLPKPAPPQLRATPAAPMTIPDDYDPLADFLPPRAMARPGAMPSAQMPGHSQLGLGQQAQAQALPMPGQRAQAAAAPSDSEVLQALLRGMRIPELKLNRPATETAEMVGAMLREATAGTMSVLLARSMTKRESRLELTQMGAQANNPLKFFPDAEAALAQMLTGAMAGYMPPVKSIGSAFDDLKAHEMAVIAGMRAALAGVLQRFNPDVIEHRMEPQGAFDKVLANRKARMWDKMVELYEEISREAEDDFQQLFGDKFSAAYEDQIGRLNQGRR
ncbi:MAG: type VI secretion system-associated FHA domain protein TagH [Pseudomonadota bacterium]